ncbi:Sec-independent protein translocase protein TatB [Pseudomonas eucalypticola]|uniref:Sec-independent protein translocase protein TatB n=1 Tax=Pseudomonas eucalypticola TaxID=2599595 RepID=A0A7D5H357_9PSED|nr:Sec-independent protein translocase protein TatB [Pseudomonas eucalypticola]QKZ02669.1 Sec-independent protein translocase subunit TatB [Pseudomonas eucalypticola]
MFGISFSELLLVGLVALLVLGPERLPGAARTAGLWVGRLKRSFNAIKAEVEREIGADEIRRQLHNEHIMSLEQEARKILNPMQQAINPAPAQPQPSAATIETPPPPAGADLGRDSHTAQPGHAPAAGQPIPEQVPGEHTPPHDPTQPPRAP